MISTHSRRTVIKTKGKMRKHHSRTTYKNRLDCSFFFFGAASLLWFLFRTGTKPSRIVYPCQRAALANSSLLLSASTLLSLTVILAKTQEFLTRRGPVLVLLIIVATAVFGSEPFWGFLQKVEAADPYQEIKLALGSRQATSSPYSDVYVVNGRSYAHANELINLMGSHGLFFYKSSTTGVNMGPNGLIASNDVVLIKINSQWNERGGTNTDVLKELIQAVVNHPDGFVGEIVVADNGQAQYGPFGSGGSLNWTDNNAEDHAQSVQDVVDVFSASFNVSTYLWDTITETIVNEYSTGDINDGYIINYTNNPLTGIQVSYPKFRTEFGTYVSFKKGIWNPATQSYDNEKLKVINFPVLKSHSGYGVTSSMKHYMGVGSAKQTNEHAMVASGGMGTQMIETRFPTLSILDAIWVNANPPPSSMGGPAAPYNYATRVNVLMAGTDPVALDYWGSKHVLVQTAQLIGYADTHTISPDNTDRSGVWGEAYGVWLPLSKNAILAGGHQATTDENHMNVYVQTQTMLGDVNRDGDVNVSDLSSLGKAYGSDPLKPNWNASCNFNSDNKIDQFDLLELSKNYGKRVPSS